MLNADVRAVLMDDLLYERAAAEAFPEYNVKNMISLDLPDRSAQVHSWITTLRTINLYC